MALTADQVKVTALAQAGPVMADMIGSALSASYASPRQRSEPRLIRLAVGLPTVDPLLWLEAQSAADRVYWSDRAGEFEIAGVGVADQVEADAGRTPADTLSELEARLSRETEPLRYFGGYRFHDGGPDRTDEWRDFKTCRFVLPKFELCRTGRRFQFICNLRPDRDRRADLMDALTDLSLSVVDKAPTLPPSTDRIDLPDRAAWNEAVDIVLNALAEGELSKLVLARRTTLAFDGDLDPVRLMRRLKARSVGCFYFCFQFAGSAVFVGASPERLYRRRGRFIDAEAVAGTRPRGDSVEEDARLGNDLLTSEKEVTEHRFVVEDIARVLNCVCHRREKSDNHGVVSLMKLARVQHLTTRLEGELSDGHTDSSVLTLLHPTSAVGGVPAATALPLIEELEPFDRGWYGGPVGWVGRDGAELAVGIRSGLVDGCRLHLYSGAGVVRGSTATGEWAEIESKLANFLAALGEYV